METKKILIADDVQETREFLRMALELNGYSVAETQDGSEVLTKALSEKPDLIILDISMPKLDGYSVAVQLNANPETQDIPVIISSGHGKMTEVFRRDKTVKISDFMEKPYLPDEILVKVRKALGES